MRGEQESLRERETHKKSLSKILYKPQSKRSISPVYGKLMALRLLSHLSFLPSSSLSPSISTAPVLSPKILQKSLTVQHKPFHGIRVPTPAQAFGGKRSLIVRASSDIDGKDESKPDILPPSQEAAVTPVENLPLESKLKEREEQQLRMKLAKKIRLRRKRLLRKRKMRKKGRWPPSKMRKLKNV